MNNIIQSDKRGGVIVQGNRVIINGKTLPPVPSLGNNITTINDNVFIDGYEFKKGKWKRTLRALFHLLM